MRSSPICPDSRRMLPSRYEQPRRRSMLDTGSSVYRVDIMTQDDVPSVSRVERRCFANPWPTSAYRRELQNPTQTYYIVLREQQQESDAPHTDIDAASSNGANAHLQSRGVPRRSLLPIGLGR